MDLKDKICLVTGGARGLGRTISEALLRRGAKVCIIDVLEEEGLETIRQFENTHGTGRVAFIYADVTNKEQMTEAFGCIVRDFGGLDVMINNAGIPEIGNQTRVFDINLHGAINALELAIDRMRTDKGGRGGVIVCTASVGGIYVHGCQPGYHATKHGLLGYTRSRALECGADYGIQFRVLCPGKMRTQLMVEVRKIVPEGTVALHPDSHPSNNEYVTINQVVEACVMCIERDDIPQGAVVKAIKSGIFLMFPEKMPSEQIS